VNISIILINIILIVVDSRRAAAAVAGIRRSPLLRGRVAPPAGRIVVRPADCRLARLSTHGARVTAEMELYVTKPP
jgi:hypothetical protein